MKGNKLENTATPKQNIKYFFVRDILNILIFKIKENIKTTKKPITILKDAICNGSKAIVAYLTDKNELPHRNPSTESKIQDDIFFYNIWKKAQLIIYFKLF